MSTSTNSRRSKLVSRDEFFEFLEAYPIDKLERYPIETGTTNYMQYVDERKPGFLQAAIVYESGYSPSYYLYT